MRSVVLLAEVVEQVQEGFGVCEPRLGRIEVTSLSNAISHPTGGKPMAKSNQQMSMSSGDGGKFPTLPGLCSYPKDGRFAEG